MHTFIAVQSALSGINSQLRVKIRQLSQEIGRLQGQLARAVSHGVAEARIRHTVWREQTELAVCACMYVYV